MINALFISRKRALGMFKRLFVYLLCLGMGEKYIVLIFCLLETILKSPPLPPSNPKNCLICQKMSIIFDSQKIGLFTGKK